MRTETRTADARQLSGDEARKTFPDRLREAFDGATNAEVARRIGAISATVKPYFDGVHLPATEILLKIRRASGVSLDWLLTGEGSRRLETRNTFSEEEEEKIREFARQNGLTFDQAVRQLSLASLDLLKKF